ncbi:dehydrogenase/reductase SDR family member 7-like [Amblyomma americanum]
MFCCLLSGPLCAALACFGAITAWFKRADADLTLLFMSRWGRPKEALKGKVIWVTGASSGIGEYIAYEFAKMGSHLVLSDTNDGNLKIVKNKCLEYGKDKKAKVSALPFNICDVSLHSEQLEKVHKHYGKVDILFISAYRSQGAFFEEISTYVDEQTFNYNLFAPISLIQCAVKYFKDNRMRGHVVVASSLAGRLKMHELRPGSHL